MHDGREHIESCGPDHPHENKADVLRGKSLNIGSSPYLTRKFATPCRTDYCANRGHCQASKTRDQRCPSCVLPFSCTPQLSDDYGCPGGKPPENCHRYKHQQLPQSRGAIAAAPKPPVRKISMIETRRWNKEESKTGIERKNTSRRMEIGLRRRFLRAKGNSMGFFIRLRGGKSISSGAGSSMGEASQPHLFLQCPWRATTAKACMADSGPGGTI